MRLDKLLGQADSRSRNQVKELIRSRQVYVDGRLAGADNLNIEPSLQRTTISGKRVKQSSEKYFLPDKPAGAVSAVSDKEHQTVIDLIKGANRAPKLYPVRRPDRSTESLLLVANDSPLGYRMLHPEYHVAKTYYIEVNAFLVDDTPAFSENGVSFDGGAICKPVKLEVITASPETNSAYVTISKGKFHQAKEMFLAYGIRVACLKRLTSGESQLGDLPNGRYHELTSTEKEILKNYLY